MKGLLGLGLVLLATVVATHVLLQDNGYVLLSYGVWSVESSLALFTGLNLLVWLLLYALLRSIINLFSVPRRVRNWQQQRGSLSMFRTHKASPSVDTGFRNSVQCTWSR